MQQVNRPKPKPFNQSETWNGVNLSIIMSQLLRLVGSHQEDDAFSRAMGAPMSELGPMVTRHIRNAATSILEETGLTATEFLSIVDERVDPKQAFFAFGHVLHLIHEDGKFKNLD